MKKMILVIVFGCVIVSLNACKSTNSCVSVDKQVINNIETKAVSLSEAAV